MYKYLFQQKVIVGFLVLAAMATLVWWIGTNPVRSLAIRLPGADNRAGRGDSAVEIVRIGAMFTRFASSIPDLEESWPRFRGPDLDNICKSDTRLKSSFGGNAPGILWSVDLGEGHAGPAIYKGAVYLLDYDEEKRADMLRCFSLTTGEEQWRRWYRVNVKRNHGMSRTVPAVTEDYILTIGPRSHVMCLRRQDGEFIWGLNVEKDYL